MVFGSVASAMISLKSSKKSECIGVKLEVNDLSLAFQHATDLRGVIADYAFCFWLGFDIVIMFGCFSRAGL